MDTKDVKIEKIAGPFDLGEGPHWDHVNKVLYFVDIMEKKISCYDPATKKVTHGYIKNGPVGAVVPVTGKKNTFIAGSGTDVIEIIWDPKTDNPNPNIKVLATIDVGKSNTRLNDGKVDPMGRFWTGSMGHVGSTFPPNEGTLYRFGPDHIPKSMATSISISNGLAWSHDNKTFYYIDSLVREVFAYDYDAATGDISNKRTIFEFSKNNLPGLPDGMTIDKNGNLWIACYNGSRVIQINPDSGKLLRQVELPAKEITSVAFGGDNLDILYVTSARQELSEEQRKADSMAGSLFAISGLGATGTPMMTYKM